MSDSKVDLSKDEDSALVPTGANSPAISQSDRIVEVGPCGVGSTVSLRRIVEPCPKCGHLICVCSLLNLVNGTGDNEGL